MPSHKRLAEQLLLPLLAASHSWNHASASPTYSYQEPVAEAHHSRSSKGAVASESRICSQIGVDLMRRGGNAADAMVGTNLCVGVVSMYHSGIGGGGFMLVRGADGSHEVIDYRETAPAAASEDMYRDNVAGSVYGGLSVGIPGELRGLEYLHNKYGSLPWRAVVNPAVKVARDGFPVTEDLVRYMAQALRTSPTNFLVDDPAWAEDFAPNGTLLKLGDTITRKRYANTLEKIGRHGADVFYKGEIAESIISLIRATNGTMTLADLASYSVTTPPAVSVGYRGYRVWSTPSPTSGAVCLSILKTMEQYPRADLLADANLTTHRFGEALRFGYAARSRLGDPAFVPGVAALERRMLTGSFAAATRRRILDGATQPVEAYGPDTEASNHHHHHQYYANPGHGTSHMVTADSSGLAVTSTTTVNLLFGAHLMTPDTGVVLNDEMNDFSIPNARNEFGFEPSPSNYVRPGKRPLSSIAPLIAEHASNGSLVLAVGAAGGSRILSSACQVAWRVLEPGVLVQGSAGDEEGAGDLVRAVAHPRMHDQLMPNTVTFEYPFDNVTVASMAARGHNVTWVGPIYSAVQGIQRLWDGTLLPASEVRQKNSGGLGI
ncbi:hypothetical protein RB595_005246 [Gaeumannomyces hyphopodioides]